MLPFEYHNPVRIIFGAGSITKLQDEIAKYGSHVLLVSYANSTALKDLLEQIHADITTTCQVTPFYAVTPNPEISMIRQGVSLAKQNQIDVIVGVGGGSVMDAAKAIAAGFYYPADLWYMVNSRHDGTHISQPPHRALPTIMVPTLPATGSEMNACAVISNVQLQEKSYIWHTCLFPQVSILDPELTYALSPYNTACGAIDTISHVLEIYINGQDKSDLLHAWQAGLMRTVIDNMRTLLNAPHDADARAELMWCATCALNGWASPGDGWTPMHQVGHVLTTRFGVPHGASLALIMPSWMEYFASYKPERYYNFARWVMHEDPHASSQCEVVARGLQAFRAFIHEIGLPASLSQIGIKASDLPNIVQDVQKISFNNTGLLQSNPPVTADNLLQILTQAL